MMLRCICAVLIITGLTTAAGKAMTDRPMRQFRSHPPMRPLPQTSSRPRADGPAVFVDGGRGLDGNSGAEDAPWKSVNHAVGQLRPGDTLYLRGGVYYEPVTLRVSGTGDRPVTIRSYPGELVIIDAGFREFFESPSSSWQPFPDGGVGEYCSTRTYPTLDTEDAPRRNVYVIGNFGDSLVPLHGYHTVEDFRSDDPYSGKRGDPLFCGPGVWYDRDTKRIHIRLPHNEVRQLGEKNYRGETDPRELPLIISGPEKCLDISESRYVRVLDLVFRGSRTHTVSVSDSEHIELDHVTLYGGAPALRAESTGYLKLTHSALRGVSAPWSSRSTEKYHGNSAYLFVSGYKEPENHDFEFAYCEFTDCHDGTYIHAIRNIRYHHNLVDNFNDDGVEVGPRRANGRMLIYQNRISRSLLTFTLHGSPNQVNILESEEVSGTYVFRNVVDRRQPVHYQPASGPDTPEEFGPAGFLCGDHAGPIWPVYYIYHNTFISAEQSWRLYYGFGWGGHMGKTVRRVFNNIFYQLSGQPGFAFSNPDADLQVDGNLLWSEDTEAFDPKTVLSTFRESKVFEGSKAQYASGWGAHDICADPLLEVFHADWKKESALTLRNGSPAIDKGIPIPSDWSDVLRDQDEGMPDIGAFPAGAKAWRVGVDGRYSVFPSGFPENP